MTMDEGFLQLSHNQLLSGAVIDRVVQRAGLPHGIVVARSWFKRDKMDICLRFRENNELLPPLGKETRSTAVPNVQAPSTKLSEFQRKTLRREQCRRSHARSRERRKQLVTRLDLSVQRLQNEIQNLELRRILGTPPRQTTWTFAIKYIRLFRFSMEHTLAPRLLLVSAAFDVTDGFEVGAEALLEHLKQFSHCFRDHHVELEALQKDPTTDSLIAITTISVIISEHTLQAAFPHLIQNGKQSCLATWLLDQRLVLHGSVRFSWDNMTNRVVRIYTQLDMLTPILRVLGSLKDVSRVFEGARVTPGGRVLKD